MAITYFGECDSSGNFTGTAGFNDASILWWRTHTCPGSGTQNVTDCAIYGIRRDAGTGACSTKLAIYTSDGNTKLIESGTGPLNNTGTSEGWAEMTLSGSLTGGTSYIIACWAGNASDGNVGILSTKCSLNTMLYIYNNTYGSGMPSTISGGDTWDGPYPYRVGTEPSGGGGGTKAKPSLRRSTKFFRKGFVFPPTLLLTANELTESFGFIIL